MSSLYNKFYLKSKSEEYLSDIFTGKKDINLDPNNLETKHEYVVLQHYLIKYLEKNGKTPDVQKFLKKYYMDFVNNPHLFVDSPLLATPFLDRYIPADSREKFKKIRDMYFDGNTSKKLYEKSKNQELSDSEKNRLYSYLIRQMDIKNDRIKDVYEDCAKRILNSNKRVNELNEMELKFYCSYIAKNTPNAVPTQLHIISREPNEGGYQNNYLVFINKDSTFKSTLDEITQVVCHEVTHARQKYESTNKETRAAFDYAEAELFLKYLNTSSYNSYMCGNNYHYSGIELDAENSGYFNGSVFLRMFNRGDLADRQFSQKQKNYSKRHYYEYMTDVNNKVKPIDNFIVENMDNIIRKHPEELKEYKVLNGMYTPDGEKRSFGSIITSKMNETVQNRGVYDNYVNYGIMHDELDNLNLNNANKTDKRRLFSSLGSVYRNKVLLFKDYCNDTDTNKYLDSQIISTTRYQMSIIYKVISYIDNNMDYVLSAKEDGNLTNRSFIYDFIYDLRDFDPSTIKNEVIKNNPDLQRGISSIKQKTDSVIKKFNRQYIKDRVSNLTSEQLNTMIKSPEGIDISLNDFLYFDLLPRMNAHSEVEINGKKEYIGDVIKYCVNKVVNINDVSNYK